MMVPGTLYFSHSTHAHSADADAADMKSSRAAQ
jgi:hypothetical protein